VKQIWLSYLCRVDLQKSPEGIEKRIEASPYQFLNWRQIPSGSVLPDKQMIFVMVAFWMFPALPRARPTTLKVPRISDKHYS
jgi:hypothetical protein